MRKTLIFILMLCISLSATAQAFDVEYIAPETTFLDSLNRDVTDDIKYLETIAASYNEKYIVTREEYIDITSIDKFYAELSAPLSLAELDNGKFTFNTEVICDDNLKRELSLFKIIGGLSDCSAVFEPVCYFNVYRNISLVGGYTRFERKHNNADAAYWQYICNVEDMTKEIVPYATRLVYLDKTRQMYINMNSDQRFKIFLLVDGKVNSVWERSDVR